MNIELVVVQPFAGYARGAVVTDAKEIERVLASNPHAVVKRAAPPAPAPAPVKGN